MSNKLSEKPLRSSARDIDRFTNSTVWYDFRLLIEERLSYLQEELIQATSTEEMYTIKGKMETASHFLDLPAMTKQNIILQNQEKKIHEQLELN